MHLVVGERDVRAGADPLFFPLGRRRRAAPPAPPEGAAGAEQLALPLASEPGAGAGAAPLADAEALRAWLARAGAKGVSRVVLTRNRSVMVSLRGGELRVHEAFLGAPVEVRQAIATFFTGRTRAERAQARRTILAFEVPRRPPRRRPTLTHPDDAKAAAKLTALHAELNARHFGGTLRAIEVQVSRRLRRRLGHYAPAPAGAEGGEGGRAEIAISRRHLRRDGWEEAAQTLLHEMVHQWQDETGLPLDHGPAFRRKAREVGVVPAARRAVDRP